MTMTANKHGNTINEIAFDWLARADGGLSSSEEAELSAWLAADTRHSGAYIRAKAVFIQANRAKAFAHTPDPDDWPLVSEAHENAAIHNVPIADNDVEAVFNIKHPFHFRSF